MTVLRASLALLLLATHAVSVSAATTCDRIGRPAPAVTTLLAAPNDTANAAWVLQPDCALEIVPLEDNGVPTLNVSDRAIRRVESFPSNANRVHLEFNSIKEGDFSTYTNLSHIILAWNDLSSIETFTFPTSSYILDFDSNQLKGIANGTIPDTVDSLYLALMELDSLANFSLPSALTVLHLEGNKFPSINFVLPKGLVEIYLDTSQRLAAIENVTMPTTLKVLSCSECPVQTFRGVQLSPRLETINFKDATLTELELRASDVDIFKLVDFNGDVDQKTCRDTSAVLQQVRPGVAACVISDAVFAAKYNGGSITSSPSLVPSSDTSNTVSPSPSPASSSSSSTITIVVAVVAGLVCLAILAFFIYRKCFRPANSSHKRDAHSHYQDATTVEAGASSVVATAASGGSSVASKSQEYLSNDIRNDEQLIAYRIAYEDVRILRVIGKGGFGVVSLATFRGRKVAVKQMLPDRAKDLRVIRSFMDEIRLSASLEHPRIVEFIGLRWSTLQDVAVVTEYLAGGDLYTALRDQETPRAIDWFEALAAGLKPKRSLALDVIVALVYLHSFDNPIIHRDLKTRNVLLSDEGDAKLSDFGTSREALLDETMTGEIGTVAWIAPEVLRGERYSEKADMYSLGVLLVELDTASHPYNNQISEASGSPPSNTQIALMVSTGKLVPSVSAECPSDVASLVASCLSYDPQQRPSAMEIHYELRKVVRDQRDGNRPYTVV